MNFLDQQTIKDWTGTPFKRSQLAQLVDWGYRQGRDFWVRRDSTLAVKADLLHSKRVTNEVTQPDFSSLATPQTNKPTPSSARLHTAG